MPSNHIASYERGLHFLKSRQEFANKNELNDMTWRDLAILKMSSSARKLRDQLAEQFNMDKRSFLKDIQFAAAVETILANCGREVFDVLFSQKRPQSRKSIMRISRTSDARQRYRVDGVRQQKFLSVAPQSSDVAYDTLTFSEVPSRLRRARGHLHSLYYSLGYETDPGFCEEVKRLMDLCRQSAQSILSFMATDRDRAITVPIALSKAAALPIINSRQVTGQVIGLGRAAVRLTIKCLWDFPEMRVRNIFPTFHEQQITITELEAIISAVDTIVQE